MHPDHHLSSAYDAVLGHWPQDTESIDVTTVHGTTHVLACGPADAPPLLLLHGGFATAAAWYANAAELCRTHRLYAPDRIGEAGLSTPGRNPPRSEAALLEWLTSVCDALGVPRTDVCGHSYGGRLALDLALRAPDRVRKLALLDPTQCFTGFSRRYLLRALPRLLKPSAHSTEAFWDWETGGSQDIAPAYRQLYVAASLAPQRIPVLGRRPKPAALRALTVPTLVLWAADSRVHDVRKADAHARRWLPGVTTATVPGVSHHGMPYVAAAETDALLADFLA
ncbi:alpha/beta fold hydrolase [Streptomyces reniochalinae]|uniref:Alpha/beta fold hydrolase n=1 Tax=Streptomyces reniochalinae TaxID=2250578 RepID=A0A367ED36_9ACTN|nr:alpha/beta fold hydrolase [Streptomyces reniochalinae]RCG15978.1 alpha/beta fold hydrolase [Streptomyces reniochalinae]